MNNRCIFTGLPTTPITDTWDANSYLVEVNKKQFLIRVPWDAYTDWPNNSFFVINKSIFHSLLFNKKWFLKNDFVISINNLEELLSDSFFPSTPKEKLDALFNRFFSMQIEDGQTIYLEDDYFTKELWIELYFKSLDEYNYYAQNLANSGLIEGEFGLTYQDSAILQNFNITYSGLNYAIQLKKLSLTSNLCFVAMAFKSETIPIRKAIKSALLRTGFKPIIIDEENIDSDQTINDAIIAKLKKCNFCIADFSYHNNGVYFESGFALGQGKKVIYT